MSFTPTPTTGSQVGIIYSTVNKQMRQHIFVDSDAEWPAIQANLPAGCSIAFVPMADHLAGSDSFHQAVATAIGVPTAAQLFTDPLCAVIDNTNTVVDLIMADASIDSVPGMTLVNTSTAGIGWAYNPQTQVFTGPAPVTVKPTS